MTPKNETAAKASWLPIIRFIVAAMLVILLQSGCANWPQPTPSVHVGAGGPKGSCADFFALLDKQTRLAERIDPGYFRIEQYPYLRTNRFLASFRDEVENDQKFNRWVDHMQILDQTARQLEIANLSDADIATLAATTSKNELYQKVIACGDLLKNSDFSNDSKRKQLRQHTFAQDDYILLRRIFGLYPITHLFVSQGVRRWHAHARERFSLDAPADWQATRYGPGVRADRRSANRIIQETQRDALGIPTYTSEDRKILFQVYAPIWEIQLQSDDDRIGTLIWTDEGGIDVDIRKPQTYTQLSFTRFKDEILTQLNYITWFPSRPKEGALDIYGGLLDGLNYRVTLNLTGEPILYETIHNCGCYYKAYATGQLQVRETIAYSEPPLIFEAPQINPALERMVVTMQSRTHYVHHLYPLPRRDQADVVAYAFTDYTVLQSLPLADGGRKSAFNRYGIIPGTERLERFILWPTGVLSPGAMRQWGRHAVAFVGRRHFDDPFYLDQMFAPTDHR